MARRRYTSASRGLLALDGGPLLRLPSSSAQRRLRRVSSNYKCGQVMRALRISNLPVQDVRCRQPYAVLSSKNTFCGADNRWSGYPRLPHTGRSARHLPSILCACNFVLMTPTDAVLVAQIVLIISEDGETAFATLCFVVGRNPATGDIFNGLLYTIRLS